MGWWGRGGWLHHSLFGGLTGELNTAAPVHQLAYQVVFFFVYQSLKTLVQILFVCLLAEGKDSTDERGLRVFECRGESTEAIPSFFLSWG